MKDDNNDVAKAFFTLYSFKSGVELYNKSTLAAAEAQRQRA